MGAGTLSVSPVGYPIAQANLLAGLMGGLPTKSAVYDGQTVNPAFATMGTAAALAGGYQPASAGASSAAAMLQNVGAAAALGVMVRFDLEQRARALAGIPARSRRTSPTTSTCPTASCSRLSSAASSATP